MNKVLMEGKVFGQPLFRMEPGEIPHLIFRVCVRHRTRAGEIRSECYRVSAWHNAALWARERLFRGQRVCVTGYLAQRAVLRGGETLREVEIAAETLYLPREEDRRFPEGGAIAGERR